MPNQVVRFLNSLRIVTGNDEREITEPHDWATIAAEQTDYR